MRAILAKAAIGLTVLLVLPACSLGSSDRHAATVRTVVVTQTPSASPSVAASSPATQPASSTTPAGPPDWDAIFASVSSGVVRIDVASCDGGATGSGFLIAPNLVATVAHVVAGYAAVRVTSPSLTTAMAGTVVGIDNKRDLALIQTDTPIKGHIFTLSRTTPAIGTEMAAIGFPLGGGIQQTTGHVTGTHNHRAVGGDGNDEYDLSDVVLSDAALNHGNSGGPWLTRAGAVIALDESGPPYNGDGSAAEGNNGGVSAADAAAQFDAWSQNPVSVQTGTCGPTAGSVDARIETLNDYFYDINNSDYGSAYAQLAKAMPNGLNTFIAGVESSQDSDPTHPGDDSYLFELDGSGTDAAGPYVDVTFESHQDADQGPDETGQTCTNWTLRYQFVDVRGLSLIVNSPAQPGMTKYRAC